MGGNYVTYVLDVDKVQWHVVTPVWSFKLGRIKHATIAAAEISLRKNFYNYSIVCEMTLFLTIFPHFQKLL